MMSLLAMTVALTVSGADQGCRTDEDCSLLGVCKSGTCLCDVGWTGSDCSRANLAPLDIEKGYANESAATWGGRAVSDGARWSLYASQFSHRCPLRLWTHNSQVIRAESISGPEGPYEFAEEVHPEFHHNPTVVGPTSDGHWLMYMIGRTNKSNIKQCEKSVPSVVDNWTVYGHSAGRIQMSWSTSPHGPWSEPRTVLQNYDKPGQNQTGWDCYVTNPSVQLLRDGSVMLVFSSVPCQYSLFIESLGVAFAPHWNATYTQSPDPIWLRPLPPPKPPAPGVGNVEDPFVWRDARGNFHIIGHSQGDICVCGIGRNASATCGVHFFARSERGPWRYSLTPVYDARAVFTNGSVATFITRQRPQIVFEEDGVTPAYLVQGGSFTEGNGGDDFSTEHTYIFRFKRSRGTAESPAERLRASLDCLSRGDGFAFGHQQTNMGGRALPTPQPFGAIDGWVDCWSTNGTFAWPACLQLNGTRSDVKIASGKFPAIAGFDFAAAISEVYDGIGIRAGTDPIPPDTSVISKLLAAARAQGSLVTVDFHVVNPVTMSTPEDHTGHPISEILPGGVANAMWTSWLDGVARLAAEDAGNAIIFRPFHEMTLMGNKSWWWATGAGVSPAEYRAAWNYTHWYLTENKGATDLLWAFAPNGGAVYNASADASTYPGDKLVDIVCFDYYGASPTYSDELLDSCRTTVEFALAHNKTPAMCETGYRKGVQNAANPKWFTEELLQPLLADETCGRIAYALTWAAGPLFLPPNHHRAVEQYWVPAKGDLTYEDFQSFTRSPSVRLAGELGECI